MAHPITDIENPLSETGISSFWRKNTSTREPVELANLLRAMQKVAGHLGPNAGRIEYEGMSSAPGGAIRIDPEWVMGRYPVPARQVDRVVGHVVRQALHHIEWSTLVWKTLEPEMESMAPMEKVKFQRVVSAGESIFLDRVADLSIFGLYTALVRDREIEHLRHRTPTKSASLDELLYSWRASEFKCRAARDCGPEYDRPEYDLISVELKGLARELFRVAERSGQVIRKCRGRASLYREAWRQLKPLLTHLPVYRKQLCWFPSGNRRSAGKPAMPSQTKPAGLVPSQLMQEVDTCLAADAVDITPLIRSVAGFDNETVAPMSRWDFNMPSRPVIDRRMIGRLKAVFRNYADRRMLVSRGLSSGRIDPGRLYRAPVNGRCFREDLRVPDPDWCIGLLIDASGSMRGSKWKMVESIVAMLYKAASGDKNRLHAWAYFESGGISMISKLLKDGVLLSVPPSGQTASGQAMIAAAMMMPKNRKRRVLIHITDGDSNFGCDVSYGIDYCRREKIHLTTLGCGYKNKAAMQAQYSPGIQFIDYFEQLPRAVENLIRALFLYGNRFDGLAKSQF